MKTAEFLARVIAPGNYLVVSTNNLQEPNSFRNKFFVGTDIAAAASYIDWAARPNPNARKPKVAWDAYHALASYTAAEPQTDAKGNVWFKGERTAKNAQRLRTFWIDLDVSRPGDGKNPAAVYASSADALRWLKSFMVATGLPRPNLGVNSGYGLHVYWVLEDALTTSAWLPYADALKAALAQHGFTGDSGVTADASRVLRPPGSVNMKSGIAVPVTIIPALNAGDYPNALVLDKLTPYLGRTPAKGSKGTTSSVLAGGAPPSALAGAGGGMAAAAQANLAQSQPREFARIATQCEQVKVSLANHGNGDSRYIWQLGHIMLAEFCVDGAQYIHPIGDGDPRYTAAETDKLAQAATHAHIVNGVGPPSCAHYESARAAVCHTCPFHGKIHSPWDLGVAVPDLPHNYRRTATAIEVQVYKVKPNGEVETKWMRLVTGDVRNPRLGRSRTGGNVITFDYLRDGNTFTIYTVAKDMPSEPGKIFAMFEPQGVTLLAGTETHWRNLVLGWIEKLRQERVERMDDPHPFGWAQDENGKHLGFAVGGTLYRVDGTEETTMGGDPQLIAAYKPKGELDEWKTACAFVAQGRPDLQTIIASSFGAPLMTFTGHSGLAISAWSRQSAVGKTSAMKVGQSVWSALGSMNSIDDTNNFVLKKIAEVRAMPCYWDEMKVGTENSDKMVGLALSLSQGKGKGRLAADTSLREVGEWDTLLISASNFPLMEHITSKTGGTDAGAVRLFEFPITIPPTQDTSAAARTIALTKTNYGSAGRVYAKWLGVNQAKADKIIGTIKDTLTTTLGAQQEERFYIAGMAAVLAGAKIANYLNLTTFDMPALEHFLCSTFRQLRVNRRTAVSVSSQGYDIEAILGAWMTDTAPRRLVTKFNIGNLGNQMQSPIVRHPTDNQQPIVVHVIQADKVMWISRAAFAAWCLVHNYPPSDVIDTIRSTWGATMGRHTLGSGTKHSTGQGRVIELPLVTPDLASYLELPPTASAKSVPRAPAQPGNQPKV